YSRCTVGPCALIRLRRRGVQSSACAATQYSAHRRTGASSTARITRRKRTFRPDRFSGVVVSGHGPPSDEMATPWRGRNDRVFGARPLEDRGVAWCDCISPRHRSSDDRVAPRAKRAPVRSLRCSAGDNSKGGKHLRPNDASSNALPTVASCGSGGGRGMTDSTVQPPLQAFDAHLAIDSVKDYAIFGLDPRGIVRSWNEGARALKGYAPGEIIGDSFTRFY